MVLYIIGVVISVLGLTFYCGCNPVRWLWDAEPLHFVGYLFATCIFCVALHEWVKYKR